MNLPALMAISSSSISFIRDHDAIFVFCNIFITLHSYTEAFVSDQSDGAFELPIFTCMPPIGGKAVLDALFGPSVQKNKIYCSVWVWRNSDFVDVQSLSQDHFTSLGLNERWCDIGQMYMKATSR